jgi:hypothetical protein
MSLASCSWRKTPRGWSHARGTGQLSYAFALIDLPWTTRTEMEPGSDYLVMASHLPLSGSPPPFMRTPPHVQLMTSLKPYMGPTKFVTWSISATDGRPSLAGALECLASG